MPANISVQDIATGEWLKPLQSNEAQPRNARIGAARPDGTDVSWHGQETVLAADASITEICAAAWDHTSWSVETARSGAVVGDPIVIDGINYYTADQVLATDRGQYPVRRYVDGPRQGQTEVIPGWKTVTDRWTPVDPDRLIEIADAVVELYNGTDNDSQIADGITLEGVAKPSFAAQLGERGESVTVAIELPTIAFDGHESEKTQQFLNISDGYDGATGLHIGTSIVRVVCSNTQQYVLGAAKAALADSADNNGLKVNAGNGTFVASIRHNAGADDNLRKAGEILLTSLGAAQAYAQSAHALMGMQLTVDDFATAVGDAGHEAFPATEDDDRTKGSLWDRRKDQRTNLLVEQFEVEAERSGATAWTAINAVSSAMTTHNLATMASNKKGLADRFGIGANSRIDTLHNVAEIYTNKILTTV